MNNLANYVHMEPTVVPSIIQPGLTAVKSNFSISSQLKVGVSSVFVFTAGMAVAPLNYNESLNTTFVKPAYTKLEGSMVPGNRYEILGSYMGVNTMLDKHPIDDFEYSSAAMDDLDNLEVMPAKSSRVLKVDSIKRVKATILEPDEEDFFYAVDIDNI